MSSKDKRHTRKLNLRDLIDYLERGKLLVGTPPGGETERHAPAVAQDIQAVAEQAICFDVGAYEELCRRNIVAANCVLPYDVCWLRTWIADRHEPFFVYILAIKQAESILLIELMEIDGTWALSGACSVPHLASDHCWPIGPAEGVSTARLATAAFLSALNCRNVVKSEQPARRKRQKLRARKGKKPLFSYWTLHLNGGDERVDSLGGSHASPRVHLRRGHPRQYAPGKWTWVQPHAVGSPAMGIVHKDYDGGGLALPPHEDG